MATQTALDLITAALKRLGVLSGIETPSADLAQDALARLNDLIESWRTESLDLYALTRVVLTPVSGKPFYVLGPDLQPASSDYGIRLPWLEQVNVQMVGTPSWEQPLVAVNDQEYDSLQMKGLYGSPTHYYYRTLFPQAHLGLWPIYDGSVPATGIIIYYPETLSGFVALTDLVVLPPGYSRALRDHLALELAPEVGRPVDPALAQSAIDAKAQLQRTNFRPRLLGMPPGIATGDRGGYDWRTE